MDAIPASPQIGRLDAQTAQAPPADDVLALPPRTAIIDGVRLRQLRRQHGLSQENLAHQAQIGLTTLARLEREPRPRCRIRTLALLAAVLDESPDAIALLIRAGKNTPAEQPRRAQSAGPLPAA